MADAEAGHNQPIIVKKIIKGGHGHHGGAWKVAYADFVTAMMAFFMLLWLLNVATEAQKNGIADYFAPTSASKSQSGAGGILGGRSMDASGARISQTARDSVILDLSPQSSERDEESDDPGTSGKSKGKNDTDGAERPANWNPDEETIEERYAELEQQRFDAAAAELRQAIQDMPDLQAMADQLLIDQTKEGLRIQLVDETRDPMFRPGTAELYGPAKRILNHVAGVIQQMNNRISITGHTDSNSSGQGGDYGNWELSTDRAHAARKQVLRAGLPDHRIAKVVGKADQDPLYAEDPKSPSNRRIAIILLREAPVLPRGMR
jgi:chemotaxis protein MotB